MAHRLTPPPPYRANRTLAVSRSAALSLTAALALYIAVSPAITRGDDLGIAAPPGFEVTLYAGDDLAHDIFSMTLDEQGRVVVAGPNYVNILHDDDGDGRADRATLFSMIPASGAHGMVFDGHDLICTGDDSLMRLVDSDGDGRADGEPQIWAHLRHPEHGANGITRGPDGWFYVACGNDAGVTADFATTPGSPVHKPGSGAMLRFSPDGKQSEIVAHGFRNPYDLTFSADGNLMTVDADGERDQYLPWYSPTRLFDVAQGMHHGWLISGWQRSWNRPPYFFDSVERLVEIGRGSPTGMETYRHRNFPAHYRGGVFSCCWTLGRVYHFPLQRSGSTYTSQREIFLETKGDVGFAPVDLAVGPEGEMYVAIGGRGTRGSVFRVRYVGDRAEEDGEAPTARDDDSDAPGSPEEMLLAVLDADQPLAAWSRAEWVPLAQKLGADPFQHAAARPRLSIRHRIRAIEILTELFDGLDVDTYDAVLAQTGPGDEESEILARAAWSLGRRPQGKAGERRLARMTYSRHPREARTAWEALAALGPLSAEAESAHWSAMLDRRDRRVRAAALLADLHRKNVDLDEPIHVADAADADTVDATDDADDDAADSAPIAQLSARLWRRYFRGKLRPEHAVDAVALFVEAEDDARRLEAVRLIQAALGDLRVEPTQPDVYAGYTLRAEAADLDRVRQAWHFHETDDPALFAEQGRLAAALGVDVNDTPYSDGAVWHSDDRTIEQQVHDLIVLSRLSGHRNEIVTAGAADVLVRLQGKMAAAQLYPSRNWPLRVGEALVELYRRDPALPEVIVEHPEFGLPEHSLLAAPMPAEQRRTATRRIIERSADDEDARWSGDLVDLVAELPDDEALPVLRRQWHDFSIRDAIAPVLARRPQAEDRARFVATLESAQPSVVETAAVALRSIGGEASTPEMATALRRLREFCADAKYVNSRRALSSLMSAWSRQKIQIKETNGGDLVQGYQPWFDWFAEAHADAVDLLSGFGGASAAEWQKRLAAIDWSAGDTERGREAYDRRSCAKCHGGSARLGPDLAGITGRLSRDDLFAAIVDPSRDVSPLYQTSQVVTRSGKVYHGLLVYESPEGTLVQTGADQTLRVAGEEILSMTPSRQSLMPTGLLQESGDEELADLYAYLKTLRPR